MPLPLPNLDDRTFADLSVELRSLIQRYDKAWTNHNPSDPGITLIELLGWLGEMLTYRMNRIEARSYLTFLELIGVQPSGPQVAVTFEINIAALPPGFVLPRGTRVAARDERSGEEIVFETTMTVPASEGDWDEDRKLWVFKVPAVNTIVVEKELLGFSSGAASQEFPLKQRPLFLARDQETYEGNPSVTVETSAKAWDYKADLLSSKPDDEHFTAEPLTGLIRFGDGLKGKIPPAGAKLLCTTYRKLGGASGNIPAGKATTLLKDPLTGADPLPGISMDSVAVHNEYAATGGTDGETLNDLLSRGLAALQERYRVVSDEDFEYLVRQAAPDKVARVTPVADRNLEGTTPIEEGDMSLIVLPALEQLGLSDQPAAYDTVTKTFVLNRSTAAVTSAIAGSRVKRLNREILRYLDERRLITTIVHVVPPSFATVRLGITLQSKPGVNTETLKQTVGKAVAAFLDPYVGWQDASGWPYGRDVYRSELYQLVDSIDGVDHVSALIMNTDPTTSLIVVGDNRLVCLDELIVTVV